MNTNANTRTIEVFRGLSWEAEIIRGLLEQNGIAVVLREGSLGAIAPYITPDVAILVSEQNRDAALEIISQREDGAGKEDIEEEKDKPA